jgi:hypothetical protein
VVKYFSILATYFFISVFSLPAQTNYRYSLQKICKIHEDTTHLLAILEIKEKNGSTGNIAVISPSKKLDSTLTAITGTHIRIKHKLMKKAPVFKKEKLRYCMTQSPYFTDFNFGSKGYDFACLIPANKKIEKNNFLLKQKCAVGKKRIKTAVLPNGEYIMIAVSMKRKAFGTVKFIKWK